MASSPDGLSSIALARFSDESDDSLAACGAGFLACASNYASAMLVIKSGDLGFPTSLKLIRHYIMLLLLTDLDVAFINKLWPDIVGNEETWYMPYSRELGLLRGDIVYTPCTGSFPVTLISNYADRRRVYATHPNFTNLYSDDSIPPVPAAPNRSGDTNHAYRLIDVTGKYPNYSCRQIRSACIF